MRLNGTKLPLGNLLNAELPVLQRAVVDTIARRVNEVGERYGFEVFAVEPFDRGRRVEVGVRANGKTALRGSYFAGVAVEGLAIGEIAQALARACEFWAKLPEHNTG